ncbi:MAG: nitroreductase [Candidatus Solibacter sp.]|nr:nitroreductase [Candidatus Solibacter sp.]
MPSRGKTPRMPANVPTWVPLPGNRVTLAAPEMGEISSLNASLARRRSVREFQDRPVSLEQVSSLLWAAQGVTGVGGLRTSPSAGAVYPLKAYLIASQVTGLTPGIYRFEPDTNELAFMEHGDRRKLLFQAAMGQECVRMSPAAVLLVSWNKRMQGEFGDHAEKLILIECGHAAQNFLLEAVSLGLGGIGLAKFDADALRAAVPFRTDEEPRYLLLAGQPGDSTK